jgi:hypothetical protein
MDSPKPLELHHHFSRGMGGPSLMEVNVSSFIHIQEHRHALSSQTKHRVPAQIDLKLQSIISRKVATLSQSNSHSPGFQIFGAIAEVEHKQRSPAPAPFMIPVFETISQILFMERYSLPFLSTCILRLSLSSVPLRCLGHSSSGW